MGKCMNESVKIQEYLDKLKDAKKKGLLYYDMSMEKHLEECDHCKQRFKAEQQLFAELDNLKSFEPPVDFSAQLMKRVACTENRSARQPLPLVSILALVVIALLSSVSIIGSSFWLWGNKQVLSYLQALTLPFLEQGWQVLYALGDFFSSLYGIISSLIQFIWLIIEVFPITSGLVILAPLFILPILIKLINNFQHENYA